MKNYSEKHKPVSVFHFLLSSILFALFLCRIPVLAADSSQTLLHPDLPEVPVYEAPEENSTPDYAAPKQRSGTASSLPSRYNAASEGLVTAAKDQNPYGTCWAFSALSACETSMIKRGLYNNTLDLSEFHLAYFFFNTQKDPLGGTAGDSNLLLYGNYLNLGGTDACSMFALAKWTGAAAESLAPYPSSDVPKLKASLGYQDIGHLQNVRYVNGTDQNSIKQLILQYGSVSAPVYMDMNKYYTPSTASYYCSRKLTTNHQIVLVGWDDTYSINNFTAGNRRPDSAGAWIAKNSYGTEFGNNGFFYISYQDLSLNNTDCLVFAYDMEGSDNYSHNYQYDGTASCTYHTFSSGDSIANVFTVKGNPGSQERLDAVSFALASDNVQYAIQIYKNPKDGNPTRGIAVFDTPQTGITSYCGYYTIPLKQPVVFQQGDRFSVVISFASSNGSIHYFTDTSSSIGEEKQLRFESKASLGESYTCKKFTGWVDIGFSGSINHRIKAFTTDTTEPATVVLPNITALTRPAISQIQVRSCSALLLSWEEVDYAAQYYIYRSTSKNGTYELIGTTASLSFRDDTAIPGKQYYYKVSANGPSRYNGTVYSNASAVRSKKLVPPKVSLRSLKKKSSKTAVLSWKRVSGASGYEVFRRESGKKWKKLKTIKKAETVQTKVSLKSGRTCYYRIRAYKTKNGRKIYGDFSTSRKIR
ncbi:MAG: lectin like domain-containing protein [Firmicutes bacterium]|nr:lectin like domain-containing protein [Bacillota bacterium]